LQVDDGVDHELTPAVNASDRVCPAENIVDFPALSSSAASFGDLSHAQMVASPSDCFIRKGGKK